MRYVQYNTLLYDSIVERRTQREGGRGRGGGYWCGGWEGREWKRQFGGDVCSVDVINGMLMFE
jgi:hypothetical protein